MTSSDFSRGARTSADPAKIADQSPLRCYGKYFKGGCVQLRDLPGCTLIGLERIHPVEIRAEMC
ncbi:hypothetical protein PROFUN_02273 [Planoprotostelium fungivorum]|uniref:Uncharacterized protein n=1 Tax=Planoprotostelium fungivorum TaxID=1890364 RepID=A0A2P6NYG4_9EUKA|nr:hypothetical protein PROFUN_02273 [Planoprotostelium fungivorum]